MTIKIWGKILCRKPLTLNLILGFVCVVYLFYTDRVVYKYQVEPDDPKNVNSEATVKIERDRKEKYLADSLFPKNKVVLNNSENYSYRVMIITHLPPGFDLYGAKSSYAFVFSTMLYASWRYVQTHYGWLRNPKEGVKADMFVYYDEYFDSKKLPIDCKELTSPEDIRINEPSQCYRRQIAYTDHSYYYINGFSFLQDSELDQIVQKYHFVLRTDPDCFLTPNFFTWRVENSVEIVFSFWTYGTAISKIMLHTMAGELGWKRQKVKTIGSTWLVRSDHFINLCEKTVYATLFVYKNGWNPDKYPIIGQFVANNPKGNWPEWWQPVSLLYGADLAVHDHFDKITTETNLRKILDVDSHHHTSENGPPNPKVKDVKHIHALHGQPDAHFDKFLFFEERKTFCSDGKISQNFETLSVKIMNKFEDRNIEEIFVAEYSYLIAIRGALDYILQNGCFKDLEQPW